MAKRRATKSNDALSFLRAAPSDSDHRTPLPRVASVTLRHAAPRVEDLDGAIRDATERLELGRRLREGDEVAITAGSRGIADICEILAGVARAVRKAGGRPFLVSAMGSHGGGTVEGQRRILRSLGITEERVGAPIRVTDRAVAVCDSDGGTVYCDEEAARADAIIVVNRIKPHTAIPGGLGSGLLKMIAVGLAKREGAAHTHATPPRELAGTIAAVAEAFVRHMPVVGGIGIVENRLHQVAELVPLAPEHFVQGEREAFRRADALMPRLPVDEIDVLVVDVMGKNISGTGIDSRVIGRWAIHDMPDPSSPSIARIVILDLTDESHGNANGLGLADVVTWRLLTKVDLEATYANVQTSGYVQRARIPVVMPDDRSAIEFAVRSAHVGAEQVRLLRIRNTMDLDEVWASEALLPELRSSPAFVWAGPFEPMKFDERGRLAPQGGAGP